MTHTSIRTALAVPYRNAPPVSHRNLRGWLRALLVEMAVPR